MQLVPRRHRSEHLLIGDAMDAMKIPEDAELTVTGRVLRPAPEATLAHGRGVREDVPL
jgi:hypothetical protein